VTIDHGGQDAAVDYRGGSGAVMGLRSEMANRFLAAPSAFDLQSQGIPRSAAVAVVLRANLVLERAQALLAV